MLFSIVKEPDISAADLNHDLEVINEWAHQWKLEFNPDPHKPAVEVLFSCKKDKIRHPPIFFNGSVVKKSKNQNHLGLILESNLSFEKHLGEKIIKAKRMIGMIKHLSKFLPLKTLDQMYKALARPHLDYCDIIYHIPSKCDNFGMFLNSTMEFVEKVQYQGALAVTGAWHGSSRSKIYDELGWESLSDRRWRRRIIQIYKIEKNLTPTFLKDKLPGHRRALYRLNNRNTFHEIVVHSNRYKNSFFPDGIKSWNIVIEHFPTIPSLFTLKAHLQSLTSPAKKSIFNIYDPLRTHILFQLRLGLSLLKSHKYNHDFLDTPSNICSCAQGIEDLNHFLFKCPFYDIQRITLINSVYEILTRNNLDILINDSSLYLYGHRTINFVDNRNILLSTMKFVKESRRFSS